MGPAVSRPDDLPSVRWGSTVYNLLQWGRPFHGRMTSSWPRHHMAVVAASMGPAVSRPDDAGLLPLLETF